MILIKYSLRIFKRNKLLNFYIILQMTMVFVMTLFMVSSFVSRYQYYSPFSEYINQTGYFSKLSSATEILNNYADEPSDISSAMKNVSEDNVIASYRVNFESNNKFAVSAFSYDNELYQKYSPQLKSGNWLNKIDDNNKYNGIPVVVYDNSNTISVGDILTEHYYDYSESDESGNPKYDDVTLEIIGILNPDSQVVHYNYNEYNDCRDIFSTASNIAESECSDILYFFRQEDILKADIFSMSDGISFIKTSIGDDDSSKYNKKIVMGISERFFDLETFNNNSIRYLTQEIQKIFPIFICMLLLTLIVIISIDTIATYKELRNYAVIYICGMSWNRIILINMIYVLLQMLFSLILAVLLCTICDLFNLLSNVIFNFSLLQIIVCTGIIIVSTLSSLILPIGIIRRNTPKQILTK